MDFCIISTVTFMTLHRSIMGCLHSDVQTLYQYMHWSDSCREGCLKNSVSHIDKWSPRRQVTTRIKTIDIVSACDMGNRDFFKYTFGLIGTVYVNSFCAPEYENSQQWYIWCDRSFRTLKPSHLCLLYINYLNLVLVYLSPNLLARLLLCLRFAV